MKNKYYFKRITTSISKTKLIQKKFGTSYGGWVIPVNMLDSKAICYCVGAGEDISFDIELARNFQCMVYIFDPTPRAKVHFEELNNRIKKGLIMAINNDESQYYKIKPEELNYLFFQPIGVWSENQVMKFYPPKNPVHVSHSLLNLQKTVDYIEVDCKKISTIMLSLGHEKITLLKLDIEGAEYQVVESLINDNIYPNILLIEFDEGNNCLDNNWLIRIENTIKKLISVGYILTNLDGWNATFIKESEISMTYLTK